MLANKTDGPEFDPKTPMVKAEKQLQAVPTSTCVPRHTCAHMHNKSIKLKLNKKKNKKERF